MARAKVQAKRPVSLPDVKVLAIDACQPAAWNPNVEDLATFNVLVESIKEHGFLEPIVVVPDADGGMNTIVAGEHRWKAAKLAGMREISAVVASGWDVDMQKAQNMRLNVLRGHLDPRKFSELWRGLEVKYGHEGALKLIGMQSKEKEVARLLAQVKRQLPPDMAAELEKRADKVRNVEDLAAVVQSLYARFGSTLQHGYVFFNYGGQTQLMVRMSSALCKRLRSTLHAMSERGQNADELVGRALLLAANESAAAADDGPVGLM